MVDHLLDELPCLRKLLSCEAAGPHLSLSTLQLKGAHLLYVYKMHNHTECIKVFIKFSFNKNCL